MDKGEDSAMITVKFKRLSDLGRPPAYAKDGDSGADLYAADVGSGILWPSETRVIWTDIAIELPEGYEAQIRPRSSLSAKGILVHLGTIDQGYRGQLGVTMTNTGDDRYIIQRGDRIAQLVVAPVLRAVFEEADELSSSERSTAGYGSSGR
jgi:dUTP pyrophosphatase